jgi:hypothetical protein
VKRHSFSRSEAAEIKAFLVELRTVDRDRQKAIRGRLRQRFGFHISDYDTTGQGFTVTDFDGLVSRGVIEVRPD